MYVFDENATVNLTSKSYSMSELYEERTYEKVVDVFRVFLI